MVCTTTELNTENYSGKQALKLIKPKKKLKTKGQNEIKTNEKCKPIIIPEFPQCILCIKVDSVILVFHTIHNDPGIDLFTADILTCLSRKNTADPNNINDGSVPFKCPRKPYQ